MYVNYIGMYTILTLYLLFKKKQKNTQDQEAIAEYLVDFYPASWGWTALALQGSTTLTVVMHESAAGKQQP